MSQDPDPRVVHLTLTEAEAEELRAFLVREKPDHPALRAVQEKLVKAHAIFALHHQVLSEADLIELLSAEHRRGALGSNAKYEAGELVSFDATHFEAYTRLGHLALPTKTARAERPTTLVAPNPASFKQRLVRSLGRAGWSVKAIEGSPKYSVQRFAKQRNET